jgi:uncharacterized protein
MIIFASIFISVMAAANFYIYRRLFKTVLLKLRWLGLVITILLMSGEILLLLSRIIPTLEKSTYLYYFSSSCVGVTFMLFAATFAYDISLTAARKIPHNPERRQAIRLIFDASVMLATLTYIIRGFIDGGKAPGINRQEIAVKEFPIDNFTIVQISDLHVGHTIKREFVEDIVTRVNHLKPDMVVITGDLLDRGADELVDDLMPLSQIVAPSYFVTGNHEYFRGVEAALILVKRLGITTLTNEHRLIKTSQGEFNLVGINDLIGERFKTSPPDLDAAYKDLNPSLPTIVLAHQPKAIHKFEQHRCDLMLSGHTHGGQIFPFGLLVKLDQPYIAGLYQHRPDQKIFVSRGTGYWGPPIRIMAPSEISYLVIKSS